MDKWTKHYLNLARETAKLSKDPSSKVGAVAVGKKKQVISSGYNGFPRGIYDFEERLGDRETKYKYVVHAELNCIYNACYTGTTLDGATLYLYGLPLCSECAKGIIQVGVSNVVMMYDVDVAERWKTSTEQAKKMLKEVGIGFEIYDLCENQVDYYDRWNESR